MHPSVPRAHDGPAPSLSPCQTRLLEFASCVPRARVAGVAGSGKTLLALEHARRSAASGRRTLLLSGGRVHARWLAESIGDAHAGRLEVLSFHGLCRRVTEAAGARFEVPEAPEARAEFLEWGAPELLLEHRDATGTSWEAIVVDGGQDFLGDWWDALERCLAPRATFHVFYDEAQDVYGARGIGALEALPGFELERCFRGVEGRSETVVAIPGPARRRDAVRELAARWLGEESLAPARVAILAPHRLGRSCLAGLGEVRGVPLTERLEEWRAGRGLLVSTIRAFRGLEADAVAVIDLPKPTEGEGFGAADLHVGRSRARRSLHLFEAEPGAALAA